MSQGKRIVLASRPVGEPKPTDFRLEECAIPTPGAGEVLLRNGQEEEGLRWLRSALAVQPDHAATHRTLAGYYQTKGKPALAAGPPRGPRRRSSASPRLHPRLERCR